MSTYTQERRQIAIETPLGKDVLLLTAFNGQEEMSRLFSYQLDLMSEKESIAAKDIVGKNVTFWVEFPDGSPRHFNGFVNRFAYGGKGDRLSLYRAEVVPWLWFLTRTADCRIFQNKTVPDIIKQIFNDLGFSDFTTDLKGSHKARDYCVQYRETDFNFVSRLMEEEGIFYYFKHEKGKHTLVIADHKNAYKDAKDKDVDFQAPQSAPTLVDHIVRWEHQYSFGTGKFAQTDYNFEAPTTSLMTNANSVVQLDGISKLEVYDFPGEYEEKKDGEALIKLRMEAEEAEHDVAHGQSYCRSFSPGAKFKLKKHASKSEEGKGYVITSVRHSGSVGGTYVSGRSTDTGGYSNTFTCIPDSVVFRPARITSKPMVHGSQTAVVVGPAGEEIYPDEYGRVKVQFHWDREGKKDDKSSCWIRVSQPWAGKQWGWIHIPRIGQEVIVSYLEGDPDRPLITGMVYNADMMPPYELPANKTQTGIKTRSSKEGGTDNFNEIRFEDKKGEEQVFIHAEKDQDIEVENDETHWVGHDREKTIDNDETNHIKRDRTETVDRHEKITIGQNRTESVGKNETINVGENRKETVGKDEGIAIGGNRTKDVTKNETISIGGDRTETVTKNAGWSIKGATTITIDKTYTQTVKDTISIESMKDILITCGSAKVVLKKDGTIDVRGKTLSITTTSDIKVKGSKIGLN